MNQTSQQMYRKLVLLSEDVDLIGTHGKSKPFNTCIKDNLSVDDVAQMHSSAKYHVLFLGFKPGFAYLDGLNTLVSIYCSNFYFVIHRALSRATEYMLSSLWATRAESKNLL